MSGGRNGKTYTTRLGDMGVTVRSSRPSNGGKGRQKAVDQVKELQHLKELQQRLTAQLEKVTLLNAASRSVIRQCHKEANRQVLERGVGDGKVTEVNRHALEKVAAKSSPEALEQLLAELPSAKPSRVEAIVAEAEAKRQILAAESKQKGPLGRGVVQKKGGR